MRISNDRSALAASVVAMVHLDDFTRLGATDVHASADGVRVDFGTTAAANLAKELVNDEFVPEVDGSSTRVPFEIAPAPDDAHVGWTDAVAAIGALKGVTAVQALDATALLYVGTKTDADARRLDGLLRDRILGLDVVVEREGTKTTLGRGASVS